MKLKPEQKEQLAICAKHVIVAFIKWCNENGIQKQQVLFEILEEKKIVPNLSVSNIGNLRSLFPWRMNERDRYHTYIYNHPAVMQRFLEIIFSLMESKNFLPEPDKKRSVETGYKIPLINNDGFVVKKELPATWHLYYYSNTKQKLSIEKKLNGESGFYNFDTARILIKKSFLKKDSGSATIILDTKPKCIYLDSYWKIKNNIVYYGAAIKTEKQQKKENEGNSKDTIYPINFIFKLNKDMNFHLGVYSYGLDENVPSCGLVIAVKESKKINQDDKQLKALIHYLLRHKKIQEKASFSYPLKDNLNKIPEQAKIWFNDVSTASGTYACYFYDPILQKFYKAYLNIDLDGTVFFYTSSNYNSEPYVGVLKKINNGKEENNLIISLGFHKDEYEYRVRIFLSKKGNNNKMLLGIYSALQFEQLQPFSSLFAAVKLKSSMKLSTIKETIAEGEDPEIPNFEKYIKNAEDFKLLLKQIKEPQIRTFFDVKELSNTHSVSLQISPEV